MAAEGGDNLEALLNKATSPGNRDEDWDSVLGFCDQVNKDLEGPQTAVRLLAHKIQSPQEREALYALCTLEACVKNCGKRFHQEIGKFRFLNEIIKVVSPKYLGNHTTQKVKTKCIEMLYSWSKALQHEPKIYEAYQMLKKQGIVTEDPVHVDTNFVAPPLPPEEDKKAVFEDEEKSKLLARLLRSKHPDDLQAANRLIKNMVKQDAERMEKVSRRVQQIETVNNNLKLLTEMLAHFNPATATESEGDVMKELYDNLEKQRPNLFRLASDTDDKDVDGINAILKCNDEVLKVMIDYKKIMEGKSGENGSLITMEEQNRGSVFESSLLNDQLLDMGLGVSSSPGTASGHIATGGATKTDMDELGDLFSSSATSNNVTSADSLLDLGLTQQQPSVVTAATQPQPGFSSFIVPPPGPGAPAFPPPPSYKQSGMPFSQTTQAPFIQATQAPFSQPTQSPFNQLPQATFSQPTQAPFNLPDPTQAGPLSSSSMLTGDGSALTSRNANPASSVLDQPLLPSTAPTLQQQQRQQSDAAAAAAAATASQHRKPPAFHELDSLGQSLMQQSLSGDNKFTPIQPSPAVKVPMNQMNKPSPALVSTASPLATPPASVSASPAKAVSDVMPLTDVFVSLESIQPGTEAPLTPYEKNGIKVVLHFGKERPRPDVSVVVISVMSTNTTPVKGFSFQAAVPKMMKVKLQPPSATDLPANNPILPPAAITQVMLVANPHKEKIRLKFKVSYSLDTETRTDVGDVDNFPFV